MGFTLNVNDHTFETLDSFTRHGRVPGLDVVLALKLAADEGFDRAAYRFTIDGLPHAVEVKADGRGFMSRIQVKLGAIPFTAEDPVRRRAALLTLRRLPTLPDAKFAIGRGQTVWSLCERHTENPLTPTALFHDIVRFAQQTRPLFRLLREQV